MIKYTTQKECNRFIERGVIDMTDEIMDASVLEEGQKIRVCGFNDKTISSFEVFQISSDHIILAPNSKAESDLVKVGNFVKLRFCVAADACRYVFDSCVDYVDELYQGLWFVRLPEKVTKRQQRDFYRIALHEFVRVVANNEDDSKVIDLYDLIDISGGGLGFMSLKKFAKDSNVFVEIDNLPEYGYLGSRGVVRRCTPIKVKGQIYYQIGISFAGYIDRCEQDKLVRYVYDIQRRRTFQALKEEHINAS